MPAMKILRLLCCSILQWAIFSGDLRKFRQQCIDSFKLMPVGIAYAERDGFRLLAASGNSQVADTLCLQLGQKFFGGRFRFENTQ